MLHTVAISGYRSIRDLVLPLTGLDVVTGPNGSGKSNVYRALRLISGLATDSAINALAREGGLGAVLWAGPEFGSGAAHAAGHPTQGTRRKGPVALRLGFSGDGVGYAADLGLPTPMDVGEDSMFRQDPVLKREWVFAGAFPKPSGLLVDRNRQVVRVRDGAWHDLPYPVPGHRSVLSEVADGASAPEVLGLRDTLREWRFYDHLRTDPGAPARLPQVGTRTPVLASDGGDLAAALRTIVEFGHGDLLQDVVRDAFTGSRLMIESRDGVFSVGLHQPGMLRGLGAAELSDGTLRFLMLAAALLSLRPPSLMVLNEPETSLHPDLYPALGALMAAAAAHTQLVVVTHASDLATCIKNAGRAQVGRLRLDKADGQTRLPDFGMLTTPAWEWPRR
ncbi:AAA family ATPase [Allobranchiibius sp. GilTou38]|uniref:AAA family ATPase n=1 Tax=Allobranchiibius sp. GilTou38 TaxID=2815210 RepID=UPI001AA10D7C|nr:AAA family ATPase [Allobranchiibius sp. GilTou38]